jgi:hypothetical protein
MDCMETRLVPAGTVVRLEQTGGGDYGDPFDPKALRQFPPRDASTETRNDGKDHQRAHPRCLGGAASWPIALARNRRRCRWSDSWALAREPLAG